MGHIDPHPSGLLVDPFFRPITYLRISVTDRCDLRCVYCMDDGTQFLPKAEVLTLEEIETLASVFIGLGTTRIRLTGGEPLVRRGVMGLVENLGARIGAGLEELTLTTNGTSLAANAAGLRAAGVKRINVSLDTLDRARFAAIARRDRLPQVLEGLEAARAAGLAIKINMVALRGGNEDEIEPMLLWCGERGFDLCLIETMPLGEIGVDRADHYLSLREVRARLERRFTLLPTRHATPGPARYVEVRETGTRLGFITPMSHNFCDSCNRVRLTCTGTLFLCLGQEDSAEFRPLLRAGADREALAAAVRAAVARKPKGHEFVIEPGNRPALIARPMSRTGG